METIKIIYQGKEKTLPLSFGKMFLAKVSTELGVGISQLDTALSKNEVMTSLQILKVSLEEGARIEKKDMSFTIEELADSWDADDNLIEDFFKRLEEGLQPKKKKAAKE